MKSLVFAAALLAATAVPTLAADEFSQPVKAAVERLLTADDTALDRALASVDAAEREAAAVVLGRRANSTPSQFAELIAAAGDDVVDVRLAATRALGAHADAALPAATRLERLAGWATEVRQRHEAALALARIPSAREHLYRVFVDPTQRAEIAAGLAELGPEGRTALVLLADAPLWRIRVVAIAALPDVDDGATDADVRAVLARRLRDESSAVRVAALRALPRVRGGALLTGADVARALAPGAPASERNALLRALADDGTDAATTDPAVRAAAALALLESVAPADRLVGARFAYAAGSTDDRVLLALAEAACSDDVGSAREAAACLREVAATRELPTAVAAALRPATRHERARIATEAAAALTLGGHDGPELAAPLTRLVFTQSWGGWRAGTMVGAPYGWGGRHRRNLRAGGGGVRAEIPPLPAVPLLALDDIVALLQRHPDAAADALAPFVAGEFFATRANAAWMAAEVCATERVAALLFPLLDDPVPAVRIVAGLRLARLGEHTDRVAGEFVELLLADPWEGSNERLVWDDEMIAELPRNRRAAVRALVGGHASHVKVTRAGEHESMTWQSPPPFEHHVRRILDALGQDAHVLLVDEMLEGDAAHRHAAATLLGRIKPLSPAAANRLRGLVDDPEFGADARSLVGE